MSLPSDGPAPHSPAPHELLDDGFAPPACELLVIGCGNLLRGDDALGPLLVRALWQRGVPDGVRLADGGTAGLDVAFQMRGAKRVVIVDAASTGAIPGTIYRVPAEELTQLPALDGLHTHSFRWDHALAFAEWLLGPSRPTDVTVYLVEAEQTDPGAELSPTVSTALNRVADLLIRDHYPAQDSEPQRHVVELTTAGYLHLDAAVAARFVPSDVLLASFDGAVLSLVPLVDPSPGGLVLKQRNAAGDRSVLLAEVLGFRDLAGLAGTYPLTDVPEAGRLDVRLRPATAAEPLERTA